MARSLLLHSTHAYNPMKPIISNLKLLIVEANTPGSISRVSYCCLGSKGRVPSDFG
jgi:hypothetical protein